jgi:hypothetical protein
MFRLSKIPKFTPTSGFSKYEIPKSIAIKKLKKFDPIDWKKYFQNNDLVDGVRMSLNNILENSNLLEWQIRSKYNLSSWSRPFWNIICSTSGSEQ